MRISVATAALSLLLPAVLTGCSASFSPSASTVGGTQMAAAITGRVHGGRQPIYQAHIYLMEANTQAYAGPGLAADDSANPTNNASKSLLQTGASSDSVGTYVLTGKDGSFSITGDYSCDPGDQVYLLSLGGDPDGSNPNPNAGLMAVLGTCDIDFDSSTTVNMNELSTVAAAYAMAGFATDATHVGAPGSTNALAATGIKNAFANAQQLFDISSNPDHTNSAPYATKVGTGIAPFQQMNTLANILAACVNTADNGGTQCSTLFSGLKSGGTTGTQATDTATEAIYMAHNPGVTSIWSVTGAGPQPYTPWSSITAPNDLSLLVRYTTQYQSIVSIAVGAAGDLWTGNQDVIDHVDHWSPLGVLSSDSPFTGGGLKQPEGLAIDSQGNVWVANTLGSSLTRISPSTTPATVSSVGAIGGFKVAVGANDTIWLANGSLYQYANDGTLLKTVSGGGLSGAAGMVALDNSGNVWAAGFASTLSEFAADGTPLSPTNGWPTGDAYPDNMAIDHSGNVWITNSGNGGPDEFAPDGTAGAQLSLGTYTSGAAVDGRGNVWVSRYSSDPAIFELDSAGNILGPSNGFVHQLGQSFAVAVDSSGNVWTAFDGLAVMVGAATPVVTPISAGVQRGTGSTRP